MKKIMSAAIILIVGTLLAVKSAPGQQWSALGSGMDESVRALAWDGSNLYAGAGTNTGPGAGG